MLPKKNSCLRFWIYKQKQLLESCKSTSTDDEGGAQAPLHKVGFVWNSIDFPRICDRLQEDMIINNWSF
ncbi:hypothetical protein MTR_5g033390 [Medicago truncatula]|uniref:Uncharacterized protein n=1 Tax=Medicago truncatula TaxID=3880 RepID=G7JZ03_MEDTR|nr:hypothetical protein MTR_5g033390 [Medicago truncatula]